MTIELKSEKEEEIEDLGKTAEEIYAKLQHTPITALGHNIAFKLDAEEKFATDHVCYDEKIKKKLPQDIPYYKADEVSTSINHGLQFKDHDYILNMIFRSEREHGKTIQFNFHYDLLKKSKEGIKAALAEFPANQALAFSLRDQLIKG